MKFNYIITIYNKEDLIADVLNSIIRCAGEESTIYCVLDGCTDRSEVIIDEIAQKEEQANIIKIHTPDVHELRTINAGLLKAEQADEGYNIILQDDVVLKDEEIEKKIISIYRKYPNLGYLSFRLAANLKQDWSDFKSGPVPYTDYIENCCGHGLNAKMLPVGSFSFRDIPIKSPVCIPFQLVRSLGMYDEILAPYGHDDIDFSLRSLQAGFVNGVYGLEFQSELNWGGTRVEGHYVVDNIIARNMDYLRVKYRSIANNMHKLKTPSDIIKIDETPTIDHSGCIKIWNKKVSPKKRRLHIPATVRAIKNRIEKRYIPRIEYYFYNKIHKPDQVFENIREIPKDISSNELYLILNYYFHKKAPDFIREHRSYIVENRKGYGENAFHAMWWLLLREFKPKNALEIGVYKGQVISLWALIAKHLGYEMNPSGVTPLLPVGDSVSIYEKADYENEIIDVFEKFSLSKPTLHRGLSTENKSVSFIESVSWDLIYIDGGHDYSVALHDYEVSKKSLKSGGLLVIDDSAKYTSYKPFSFSFGGHVGPSLVASLYADRELIKLCNVGHNSIYLKP